MSDIYKRAVKQYGIESQIKKTIEECSELIVALMHSADGKATVVDVADEVADVEIMLKQMRVIIGDKKVDERRRYKETRLEKDAVMTCPCCGGEMYIESWEGWRWQCPFCDHQDRFATDEECNEWDKQQARAWASVFPESN